MAEGRRRQSHDAPLPWADRGAELRVALISSDHARLTDEICQTTRAAIEQVAALVFEDLKGDAMDRLRDCEVDLVLVLGGDGSILRAARGMADRQLPVLGVNLGKLGFLADVSTEDVAPAMHAVRDGACRLIDHMMFTCEIWRDGQFVSSTLGLNETAVLGGPPYSMMEIDLYVDGELATTYSCDGLIVSTPVGSTAHGLSAGGPIVRKDLEAFVILPVSPHTLTVRPVVDAAERILEMVVQHPQEMTSVVVDGQLIHHVRAEDLMRIRRAEQRFRMIQVPGQTYYRTLREKLGWAGRIANKKHDP